MKRKIVIATLVLLALTSVFLSFRMASAAVTGSTNPNAHISILHYSCSGQSITEIWYRAVPSMCSSKDQLIAKITFGSCKFTLYTCVFGWCFNPYDVNYCKQIIQKAVTTFLDRYWTWLVTVALIAGGYITVTIPYWGPPIAALI